MCQWKYMTLNSDVKMHDFVRIQFIYTKITWLQVILNMHYDLQLYETKHNIFIKHNYNVNIKLCILLYINIYIIIIL